MLDGMCSVYYNVHMIDTFGRHIRQKRESLERDGHPLSVRKLAGLIGVEPSYLSKVERGETPPPSEAKIALFRSLFRGRDDVYPRRFESRKTGKAGYAPACATEWVRDICSPTMSRRSWTSCSTRSCDR